MDKTEITHLVISWLTITLAFSLATIELGLSSFIKNFLLLSIVLGLGFILHELGHRTVARHFGLIAFYRAWIPGLLLALGMALVTKGRMIFAAPGAVYIGGRAISIRENGLISLAGPLTNILLAFAFLPLAFMPGVISILGGYGFYVNMILAGFNLIPIPPLDGSKVIMWSPAVWLISIAIPAIFYFLL